MVLIVAGTTANAYSLAEAAEPRERPPAGYSSDVYIDSRGCAYVRANIGNTVNWVPRLTGDRKQVVCGMTPSANTRRTAAVAPPPPLVAAPVAPVQPQPVNVPMTTLAVATPAAEARTLSVTCPADGSEARVRVGNSTIRVTCAPGQTQPATTMISHANGARTRLIINPPADVPGTLPVVTARAPSATAPAPLPAGSARVLIGGVPPGGASNNFGSGYGVGVGSAVTAPVPSVATGLPVATYRVPTTTVAPVAPAFGSGYGLPVQPDAGRVYVPAGYRPAWDDDRLNPNRGPRTALGDAQMAAVWTNDQPMRPVEGVRPVVSTKGAAAPAPQATGAGYVQIGVFGNPANATAAANKLASLGLPGRIGKTASGLSVVMAGPFTDAGALQNALSVVRRNGFSDAFTRG